jgi:hypothetical protein
MEETGIAMEETGIAMEETGIASGICIPGTWDGIICAGPGIIIPAIGAEIF